MFYLNKLRNRIHKLRYQNYLGGEGIEKQWNIFGYKFDYTLLPKCEKVCETFYKNNKVYLSITAVLQNEAPYIKEWIEYHRLVGVERFYIYDNESTDNVKEILKPYIDLENFIALTIALDVTYADKVPTKLMSAFKSPSDNAYIVSPPRVV